jgi:hypothetical protein
MNDACGFHHQPRSRHRFRDGRGWRAALVQPLRRAVARQ